MKPVIAPQCRLGIDTGPSLACSPDRPLPHIVAALLVFTGTFVFPGIIGENPKPFGQLLLDGGVLGLGERRLLLYPSGGGGSVAVLPQALPEDCLCRGLQRPPRKVMLRLARTGYW